MKHIRFYHHHSMHRLAEHPDFYFFELAIWLHTLARSLISIFIPILLLQTGYSIVTVLIYYLIYIIIDVPLNFAVDGLVRKFGAKRIMIAATITSIAFFTLLGVLPKESWPLLILLALFAAIYDTLYWVSHMYIFIETNRGEEDTGGKVGALVAVRRFASVVGPLIGALIFVLGGKGLLTVVSALIFALSVIPLFKLRHARDVPTTKRIPFRKFLADKREKKDYLSLALLGVHYEADEILWPIFIFTLFGSMGSVAAIPVIVSLTTALLSYLAGRLTRRFAHRMIIIGSALIACIWIVRLITHEPIIYYISIFLVGFFSLLVSIPIDRSVTERGLELDSLTAATYRNATLMAFRIPFYIVLVVLLEVFKISFILAALSLFLILAVTVLLRSKTISQTAVPVRV